jgi:tetratricopeptide (TPR) repeat protein
MEASAAIVELRNVLTDYGFNASSMGSAGIGEQLPTLRDLERDLKVTFDAYQQSRFTIAAGRVSTLLADAQLVLLEQSAGERGEVFGILALSCQAAASVLIKAGEPDLAWIAAERGLIAAGNANSPAIRGSLIRSVAFSLLSTGRSDAAMRLIESGGSFMESEGVEGSSMMSVHGTLFLAGAMAAARFGDRARTADYLAEANDAACRLGRDSNDLWTAFGPANVAVHRVNTAAELGDMQTVLDSAESLNVATLPVERKVRYLFDVAQAYSLTGKRNEALDILIKAERMAPEHVRQHHLAKKVVMTLVQKSAGKPSVELGKLAQRVNVAAAF